MSLAPSADPDREDIVGDGDKGKQTEIQPAALVIEIIGERRDEEESRRELVLQHSINKGESEKQEQEQTTAEDKRLSRVICEFFYYQLNHYFYQCLLKISLFRKKYHSSVNALNMISAIYRPPRKLRWA